MSKHATHQWRGMLLLFVMTFMLWGFLGTKSVAAAPQAVTWPPINLTLVEGGFANPVGLVSPNDGTNRLFVVERGGRIYIIEDGERLATPFLDISDRISNINASGCFECGLLGLAFPPDFAESGHFFVNYTSATDLIGPDTGDPDPTDMGDTVIARFHVSANPNIANASTEEQILVVNQPDKNHNGGQIFFGEDGYFYIGMGDGGGSGDSYNNAQDPASLLGKILRIEVGASGLYTVPVTNPFTTTVGYRDEIWALGVRNPWRFHFDRITGDLYIADVGQVSIEEVNYIAAAEIGNGGFNFGWPIMEGDKCYPPSGSQDCDRTGLIAPVTTYDHTSGDCSITGGYVYHTLTAGQPAVYLYADFCTGRLRGLQPDGASWATIGLEDYTFQIPTLGDDAAGNVYIVSYAGNVYVIDSGFAGLNAENDGPKKVNVPINFTATITSGIGVTFAWDFGDGSNGSGITTTHAYTPSGIYTATVVATNVTNTLTATTTVYVGDAIVEVINNEYAPRDVTVPPGGKVVWVLREGVHSVTADDDSFNQPIGSDWSPFLHTFTTANEYPYYCSAHGGPGGVGMAGSVTVTDGAIPPITGLTASNGGPSKVNTTTAFTASVTGGTDIAYAWDFGDGSNGSGSTPSHIYTESGVYTATVVATNATNSMTATTTVYIGDAIVEVVNNEYLPRDVTIPSGGKVVWVLREGSHSVTADDNSFNQPAGTDWPPFMRQFEVSSVSIAATDIIGYYCTVHGGPGGVGMAGSVTVTDDFVPAITGLAASNDGPSKVNTTTAFTATVTGGTDITYGWAFGDGSNGSGSAPSHTYTSSGIYTATVVATNATNSMTATTTVYVGDAIVEVVNNEYLPRDVTIPSGGKVVWVLREGSHSVTADDDSFNQPIGSDWSPFVYTFTAANEYPYYCSAHGGPGGVGMAGSVTVTDGAIPPITGLTASNGGPSKVNTTTAFTASVTGGTDITYAWSFGDGSNGSGSTPSHTYTSSGVYTATVVATNATNSMTATTTVYVGDAIVEVIDNEYLPRDVTIPSGGKVVWVLREGVHSVTADDDSFNQPIGSDWSPFVHTFTTANEYPYYCSAHGGPGGVGMAGSVTVTDDISPEEGAEIHLPTLWGNDD